MTQSHGKFRYFYLTFSAFLVIKRLQHAELRMFFRSYSPTSPLKSSQKRCGTHRSPRWLHTKNQLNRLYIMGGRFYQTLLLYKPQRNITLKRHQRKQDRRLRQHHRGHLLQSSRCQRRAYGAAPQRTRWGHNTPCAWLTLSYWLSRQLPIIPRTPPWNSFRVSTNVGLSPRAH